MADSAKKIVSLDVLKAAINKIKTDYATNNAVEAKIQTVSENLTYASEEEVMSLFSDAAAASETDPSN